VKISISATNPCHLYPVALELAKRDALGCYYSGYPAWKLNAPPELALRTHSLRTNIVYGLLKYAPEQWRPSSKQLYRWQDGGFDRWTGAHLKPCDFIHAMPGQALHTFRAARRLGIPTVLNHATGPVREWVRIVEPELQRVGLKLQDIYHYDAEYFVREDEEYALTDWHCAASSVVREQLIAQGIDARRIWQVPYGADERVFHAEGRTSPADFRIIFAGQVVLRKGLRTFLEALEKLARADWRVDFFGGVASESKQDLAAYRGATPLHFHGPVSQQRLATAFREASVMVLPSFEEGFGLVVPQALNCGLPTIVSDRVGAKDLVTHHENGSIFPTGDATALTEELVWWSENPREITTRFGWSAPTQTLIDFSHSARS